MKGIILAAGKATRLYPITKGVCKQLLPVYDKPMIYYPLSVLLLAGIKDILIITTPQDQVRFKDLLGDGSEIGVRFEYAKQDQPRGIAESLLIAEHFIGKDNVCLILGDNVFFGHGLPDLLKKAAVKKNGASVFAYYVKDPQRYGVITFDERNRVLSLQEKPKKPLSNWAVTGLYFYDHRAVSFAKRLKPSARGELEITDINRAYLREKMLHVTLLGRGYAWLDTGTYESLIDASTFIKTIEERQGLKIGCIEEISWRMGNIGSKQLRVLAEGIRTSYGDYLMRISNEQ